MAKKLSNNKIFEKFLTFVLYLSVVPIVFVPLFYRMNFEGGFSSQQGDWADFGSYVGGSLGPILSFVSILIVLWALKSQVKDSKIKQDQDTYFKLLEFLNHTISEIEIDRYVNGELVSTRNGNSALKSILEKFRTEIIAIKKDHSLSLSTLENTYQGFYKKNRTALGSYFRLIESILSFLDRSSFDEIEKNEYATILKSICSQVQMQLLFYEGIVGKRKVKLKGLIEKYAFFEHLELDENGPSIEFKKEYNLNAFSENQN